MQTPHKGYPTWDKVTNMKGTYIYIYIYHCDIHYPVVKIY